MNVDLGREVVAMLNIEAGEPLYRHSEDSTIRRVDCPRGFWVYVDGHESRLIVVALSHRRGFGFPWRDAHPNKRFDWTAIHKRVEKILAEERQRTGGTVK